VLAALVIIQPATSFRLPSIPLALFFLGLLIAVVAVVNFIYLRAYTYSAGTGLYLTLASGLVAAGCSYWQTVSTLRRQP
jgi:hypothetical protein